MNHLGGLSFHFGLFLTTTRGLLYLLKHILWRCLLLSVVNLASLPCIYLPTLPQCSTLLDLICQHSTLFSEIYRSDKRVLEYHWLIIPYKYQYSYVIYNPTNYYVVSSIVRSALSAFKWPKLSRSVKTYPRNHCTAFQFRFPACCPGEIRNQHDTGHTTGVWIAYHEPKSPLLCVQRTARHLDAQG